jgi:hypothetical protein
MKETFRLRPSSRVIHIALCGTLLLTFATAIFCADYPTPRMPHQGGTSMSAARRATNAKDALFEQNDLRRAMKLAVRELRRNPKNIDSWFVLEESAALLEDQRNELRALLAVCRLAKEDDPRAVAAARRLSSFGQNSEAFRQQRAASDALASGNSACASGALEALYQAALDGLNNGNVRDLARRVGWQTNWNISRAGAAASKFLPEQFEFVDARVKLPDYLPRAASYVAVTTYAAAETGDYVISGDTAAAKLFVDDRPLDFGRVSLRAGAHTVRIAFRAEDSTPRIRIAPLSEVELRWTGLRLSARESLYLQAVAALAAGSARESSELLRPSRLATTAIGMELLGQIGNTVPASTDFESVLAHPSCGNLQAALNGSGESGSIAKQLQSCAPDSLAYAHWLAAADRHDEAIQELNRLLRDWPLDRDAHRMLIAELQRVGNSVAADRAAADLLAIAPNAHNFRRMAQNATADLNESGVPFYETYRRPAPSALPAFETSLFPEIILLQDKISIARRDGSVSLYMHRVVELMTSAGAQDFKPLAIPEGAQLLTARVVNSETKFSSTLPSTLKSGDEIEEEYIVNYTGDGGMIAHSEAFQYVFNDFDFPLLSARFVVLSSSKESPGYVIASGNVPESRMEYVNGLCAQIWEQDHASSIPASDPGIVRVVENENGWSIPPSVERRRNLETIHPGPRPHEA